MNIFKNNMSARGGSASGGKNTHVLSILSVALLLAVTSFFGSAWADEDESENGIRDKRPEIRTEIKDTREEFRTDVKGQREELRSSVSTAREELEERNRQAREAFRIQVDQRKDELRARVKTEREELKDTIEQKREELKQELEKIKDERKKEVVEKIDKRLDELNERMLDHYANILDKLGDVLVRIAERADRAEEKGIDVSAVRTAIDEANDAIAAAKSAVEEQAGKTYTIEITDEDGLRTDVGRARQALHGDLKAVRLMVKAAHEAVRNAATTLAQLPRPTPTPEPTESPTPTPTPTPDE